MQHSKRILDLCKNFVSKEELRPNIMGINYSEFGVCATDAHSLILIKEEGIHESLYGTYNLKGEKIEERYPDFMRVIPSKDMFDKFFTLNTKDLLHVCNCLSNINPNGFLKFTFTSKQEVIINTNDVDFEIEAKARLECEYINSSFATHSFVLDVNRLIIALKVLIKEGCNVATLKTYGQNRPLVIEHGYITTLLMAVDINI